MRKSAVVVALLLFLLTWSLPVTAATPKSQHRVASKSMKAPVKAVKKPVKKPVKKAVKKPVKRLRAKALVLPRLTVGADGVVLPDFRAAAAVVYDPITAEVLYESHSQELRPIASITKVMTAVVFLETVPDLSEVVTVKAADTYRASHTYLRAGDRVTVDNLMHLLLIASDNAAARVLARVSIHGAVGFVARMNTTAQDMGLAHTTYADSSGLLKANVSTALDMAKLIVAVSSNDYISRIMQTTSHAFRTVAKRVVSFRTTDHLLMHDMPVVAAKTGFTNPAGFCLASLLRVPDAVRSVAIVVLGARTNAERFVEVENLYQWWTLREKTTLNVHDVLPAVHLSEKGIEFIKRVEGFHAKPYKDSGGYAVGYGFHQWNGKPVTRFFPKFVTQDEADAQFLDQLNIYEAVVAESVTSPLSQSAYDALVSVAYNLGRVNTRIIDKLSAGLAVTPRDFLATATVRNRPNAGLQMRRLKEFLVFAGDYHGAFLK